MPSLKDIANRVGCSVSAVSLALRGSAEVSVQRAEQIRRVAKELGYQRNTYLSSQMRRVRRCSHLPQNLTVALLLVHPQRNAHKDIVLVNRRLKGMEARAKERGYVPAFFWYNDPDCSPGRLNKILHARGIRGVALSLFEEGGGVARLDWDRFAVSKQDDYRQPAIHCVTEDYFANTLTALGELWRRGYRRISVVYPAWHAPNAYARIVAAYLFFTHAMQSHGIEPIEVFISARWTRDAFMQWFHREKPDALLTFSWGDIPGWLEQAGITVGEEVGVAALNRCPSAPEISGIDPEPERLGAISVDLVLDQIENNEYGLPKNPKVITVASPWLEGTSTRSLSSIKSTPGYPLQQQPWNPSLLTQPNFKM